MPLSREEEEAVKAYALSLPGLRGRDIPESIYDRIRPVADGITMQTWGRPATPEQMQWLHDNGKHDPASIHQAFGSLTHPHAPDLTLGEYEAHSSALQMYNKHGGQM